jgi:hypothetical protein
MTSIQSQTRVGTEHSDPPVIRVEVPLGWLVIDLRTLQPLLTLLSLACSLVRCAVGRELLAVGAAP